VLLFLTPSGREAESIERQVADEHRRCGELLYWSWERDIRLWLSSCQAACDSEKIRHFLEDFDSYVVRYLNTTARHEAE
jgi:hypothetical protein